MRPGQVIILHEWDGPAYFQALDRMVRAETGAPPVYRELWFIRQILLGLLRRNPALVMRGLRNAGFFLQSFFLRDRVVVMGLAPFDWSLFFWSRLRKRNRVVYHTSWLTWDGARVVHKGGALPSVIRVRWREFLEDPRVKVVSVLAESGADMRRNYRKPEADFAVIPHGVDLADFRPAEAAGPPDSWVTGPLRVLYLGRLNSVKGIDVVAGLIAAADPARFRFGVAGDGPEWTRLEPLKRRFDYHGRVDGKAAVADLLRRYDVLILPSVSEQFGLALIEAMACGAACIASDGLIPKDLVVDGKNGRILPRTVEAFLAALEDLAAHPEKRAEFRRRGLERVREFDLDAVGARWKRILG